MIQALAATWLGQSSKFAPTAPHSSRHRHLLLHISILSSASVLVRVSFIALGSDLDLVSCFVAKQ